jgi:hypothetical protein
MGSSLTVFGTTKKMQCWVPLYLLVVPMCDFSSNGHTHASMLAHSHDTKQFAYGYAEPPAGAVALAAAAAFSASAYREQYELVHHYMVRNSY